MSQFQLFPPLAPADRAATAPLQTRKASVIPQSSSTASIPLEDLHGTGKTDAVLRQIEKGMKAVQPPFKAHLKSKSESMVEAKPSKPSRSWTLRRGNRQNNKWTAPSNTSSPTTLDISSGSGSQTFPFPMPASSPDGKVPMRSMFPQYNPNLSLSQQHYYPQPPSSPPPRSQSRHKPKGLTLSTEPEIDRDLGPKTVPASVMNFPAGILDSVGVQYSSAAELRGLWEAANGQRPRGSLGSFNLPLSRTELETFTCGDPKQPFYTFQTNPTNKLSISRADPSKPNSSVPIMALTLEDGRRREPPNDGLVSYIFSRLAAMLAVEQANELATQYHLSPVDALEAEGKALRRAAEHESCRLAWNHDRRLYELHHPSLLSKQRLPPLPPALIGAAGIPLSPAPDTQSKDSETLHITISTPSNDARHPQPQPPTIIVTAPMPVNATQSARLAATSRTSTLPLTESDDPLASLDLGTMTLTISAASVIAMVPSLYAIDSVVAAILAVAVSDEVTKPVLLDMELHRQSQGWSRSQGGSCSFDGTLVATLAEREDAVQGSDLIDQIKSFPTDSPKTKTNHNITPMGNIFNWSRSQFAKVHSPQKPSPQKPSPQKPSPNPKPPSKQITTQDIDLEHYGCHGPDSSSSREEQEFPRVTRGILSGLFWGLDLVVRALTFVVGALAWLVVNLSMWVNSKQV